MISKTAIMVGCAGAAAAIYLYSKAGYKTEADADIHTDDIVYVVVPRGSLGAILGRNGRNATAIFNEHQTYIRGPGLSAPGIQKLMMSGANVLDWNGPQEDTKWLRNPKKIAEGDVISIKAPTKVKLELVILLIRGLIADWQTSRAVEQIRIPKTVVGFIIGKHGRTIKQISSECRVRTCLVDAEGDYEVMEIRGSEEGIAAAVDRIQSTVSRFYRNFAASRTTGDSAGQQHHHSVSEIQEAEQLKELLEADEDLW